MSLSPIGNPAWKTVRGVRFAMQYGASLVAILVTNAALDEMELVPEKGYLERFNKHRDAIEKVAINAARLRKVGWWSYKQLI